MSFDIFLVPVTEGEKFSRTLVEHAFQKLVADQTGDYWHLQLADGESCSGTLSIDDEPQISGFVVNRPPFVPEFWDAIFDVLRQTRTLLAWPGNEEFPTYCIANPELAASIPSGLVESLGERAIVANGLAIQMAIERVE